MIIPAGTTIELRLDRSVSPRSHRIGQQVTARLASPVTVGGRTALPTGMRITGTVTESRRAVKATTARLRIDFHRALLADGTSLPISCSVLCIGEGAVLAPAMTVPGKAGRPAVLRAGTILVGVLDASLAVPQAGTR
jgi:hypothetical protein